MANVPTDSPPHDIARPLPNNSAEPPPSDPTSSSPTPPPSHDVSPTAVSGESTRVLAVPVASITHPNPSQSSFVLSTGNRAVEVSASALPSEVGKADLHIAADGSFVQTSSAHAARELKKAYDHILRESLGAQGGIRSPYAITAVQDTSGNAVFRIGYREPSVDTPETAETPSEPSSSYSPGHAAGPRRKARLSVHDFLPSSMFKPNAGGSTLPRNTSSFSSGSAFTPPNTNIPPAHHAPRNKLRKQRSNSDLHLRGTSNPPQSSATASGEGAVPVSPPPRSESFAIEIRDEITAGADAFSQVLAWSSELVTDSVPPSRKSSKASNPPADEQQDGLAPATMNSSLSRRPSVSTSAALSTSTGDIGGSPFGENVRYTAPMRRSAIFLAPKAPQLREMQSFESGLTARVGDDKEIPGTPKSKTYTDPKKDGEEVFLVAKNQARFSTSVFDVLQTYRGLPLPNTLSELSTGATIKLSTTDSPNPKDDPRFVIWGELQGEGSCVDDASLSHSQSSHTDLSASISSAASSRKRSNARPPHANNDTPSLGVSCDFTNKTVMIAATVERWIAQLTSELNYDELLNFLLTYRTYIAPVDLCHLLICRFHWALEPPRQHEDSTVRNIVRFRTFIAIRYWLLTFFREDFLPNPELCHLFATWLNALFRDPALAKHADALSMVRKLKKIVRECKAAHSRHGRAGLGRPSMDSRSTPYTSTNGILDTSSQGVAGKKSNGEKAGEEIDDSDVDLDFSPEANAHYTDYSANEGTVGALHQITESDAQNASPPIRPPVPIPPVQGQAAATPSANSILLSQPLSMAILGHVKSMGTGTDMPLTQMPSSLPVQHSAISRAFVNTIGRLGRWKRVLNSRPGAPAPLCGDVSAYDLELNATGDLLFVRGGVEEYLKMLNISPQILPNPGTPSQTSTSHKTGESGNPVRPPGLGPSSGDEPTTKAKMSRPNSLHLDALDEEGENLEQQNTPQTRERDSHNSVISETTDTSDSLASTGLSSDVSAGWTPEIVSLDDYDLSDSDSSSHSPARVRRLPRRLPLRRDFQFVRRSIDTVSSMGIRSHSSLTSSMKSGSASGSIRYPSRGSDMSEGRSLVIGIQNWQIELIDTDDEDEAGDAEAALRRLEGQIDVDRQREKDIKVGRWLRTARQRDQDSTSSSIHSGSLVSEEGPETETNEETAHDPHDGEDLTVSMNSVRSSAAETAVSVTETTPLLAADSTRTITSGTVTAPPTSKPPVARDRSGSVESVQMQTSRPTSRRPSLLGKTSRGPQPSKFNSTNVPALHRSFILMHRSETLAQQFAIIEAELFAKVKFEELISHQWGQSPEDVNVRDWGQFVKERARLKNTGSSSTPDRAVRAKLSAILALRARFDLLVNFTASEVLLTHSSGRVIVVEKFIRIAWKAYLHNNFSTLVALMAGLQTRWVNLAMSRHWHKVGMREQRLFDDLRKFTTRTEEFKFLRQTTAALVDSQPLGPAAKDGGNAAKAANGGSSKSKAAEVRSPPACVPFLGMYLAQLYDHEKLPDFVDPSAPSEPVLIDPESGNLSSPAQPDVFSSLQALPGDLDLEPLINVHKQRLIAGVIKSFVAGQHLATNIRFDVDQKSWQKCFRLRSLESDELHTIAKTLPDA